MIQLFQEGSSSRENSDEGCASASGLMFGCRGTVSRGVWVLSVRNGRCSGCSSLMAFTIGTYLEEVLLCACLITGKMMRTLKLFGEDVHATETASFPRCSELGDGLLIMSSAI